MAQFEWDLGMAVLSEYDKDGFIGVSFDGYGEKNSGVPAGELHSPYGFLSRPLDPDVDSEGNPKLGCNLWRVFEGNVPHALLAQDPRVVPNLPELKKGESLQHGAASNFVRCKEDGSVVIMTTADGKPTGQSIFVRVSGSDVLIFAPWGKFAFDANGLYVFTHSGARLNLGGVGGLPSPLSALNSYAKMTAQVVRLEGALVALGPSGAPADAVAKSTPILAVFNALTGVLTALAAPGAYVSPPTGGPCAAGPGVLAAIATAETALAAAVAAVPSNSTTVS